MKKFWQKYNWLIISIVAGLVLAAGIYAYLSWQDAKEGGINKKDQTDNTTSGKTPKNDSSDNSTTKDNGIPALSEIQALYEQKEYDQALVEIAILANTNPNGEVLNLYGNILRDSGDKAAAKSKYEQAISLDPNLIVAYTNLAIIYQEEGNIDKAKEVLNQGLAANPGNEDLQNSLAILEITPHSE
ncbi:MAG: tetratricopeptide repeat protein [Patescibacteria group bacterium]|nr:tetratricopeptide repeat protein [Patescibacteria group bacterium]